MSVPAGTLDLIAAIPKAEIHLHLEGSVDLDTLVELRRRRGEPTGPEARRRLGRLYAHEDFPGFLRNYRDLCAEIAGPEDFSLITEALARRLQGENVRYAEVMCSPMIFTRRGIPAPEIMGAVGEAARRIEGLGGPRLRFLFDGVRQWGPGAQEELVGLADACRGEGVIGVGIGGDEKAWPAGAFAGAFREARRRGLRTTAHAGEFDGPRSVREAIEVLEVDRIGHGIRAAEDPGLLADLARRRIPLECCPTSNVKTGVVRSWREHPIRALRAAGVLVTVNSDDPALFGTSLAGEWRALAERLGLAAEEILAIGIRTVESAFADEAFKGTLITEMKSVAARFGAGA